MTTDITKLSQEELETRLDEYNIMYRGSGALIPDDVYNAMEDELRKRFPESEFLKKIGGIAPEQEGRKVKIPVTMTSMDKIKTESEYKKWLEKKGISEDTLMIITGKYDGMSCCFDHQEKQAWTGGDGEFGLPIADHLALIKISENIHNGEVITVGEVIISRDKFPEFEKTEANPDGYENGRNMVGGKLNDIVPDKNAVSKFDFIQYTIAYSDNAAIAIMSKVEQLRWLNGFYNTIKVKFIEVRAGDITEEMLNNLFKEWNVEYELDGLIIEVDSYDLRKKLGFEASTGNPAYARAFKGDFEDRADTEIIEITYQTSKRGYQKPVMWIEPVRLNGVTVRKMFVDNAAFVTNFRLHPGAQITVKRSGMVIPRICNINGHVIPSPKPENMWAIDELIKLRKQEANEVDLPVACQHCASPNEWNESKVEWMCSNVDCEGVQLQRIIAFMEHIGVRDVSDGVCEMLYNAGYDTIPKILDLSQSDMERVPGFARRKAEIVYTAIHKKIKNVPLEVAQHATGYFKNLGSKKLALVKHFKAKPTHEDLVKVPGFAEKSADSYLAGIDKFWSFMAQVSNMTIKLVEDKAPELKSNRFSGKVFVFTGFRDKAAEQEIALNGGTIGTSVSSKTTHLVMRQKGSGSKKEQDAKKKGIIIMDEAEFKAMMASKETAVEGFKW